MAEVYVRDEGFTVLSQGIEPVADLVFIHGIQGHPEKTWTFGKKEKESTKPKSGVAKLFSRKNQPTKTERGGCNRIPHLFWPKDLLAKDYPDVRVLTYGYDSQVSKFFKGPANQSGILAHGESLMHALEVQRRGCRQRPIIFLVHSLGGIILKQALSRSRNAMEEDQDLRDIYQSTYAIIFFGTPHRGSSYAQMGVLAKDIVVAAGFDARDTLLRSLKPDAEVLSLLRQEFSRMLYDRAFKIYSFQEGQGLKGTYSLSRKIVDDDSSRLDDVREGRDFINANHMMMCRFRDSNDDGYNKVKGVVSKYVDEIRAQLFKERDRLDLERNLLVKEICVSLKTAHMNERVGEVTTAHTHTFDWVFTNSKTGFVDWLHSNQSLFWITGKPGSGKSTLMKYLVQDSRTKEALSKQGQSILSTPVFFFHARGVETEKSFDGLLRSILYQLLSDVPALVDSVADIYREDMEKSLVCRWTIPQLERALNNIRQQKIDGCVCLFIDALDEYSGRSEDIAHFVRLLAAPTNSNNNQKLVIRVCASSRPWTTFTSLLKDTPSFTIQTWTAKDISTFAADRLAGCNRINTDLILNEITKRSEGIFLWVKLVLDELWQPLCDGKPIEDVLSLLSNLPTDLPEFYKRMVENISEEDHTVLICMLELVLCSNYHAYGISYTAFCLVVDLFQRNSSAMKEVSLEPTDDSRRRHEVERRIRACSGGLLEISQSPEISFGVGGARVQFVHQTVKSFIGDTKNSAIFNGKSPKDMAVAGTQRMMRLMTLLIPQMDSTQKWPGLVRLDTYSVDPTCPKHFPHFDSNLVRNFISWALVAECAFEITSPRLMHDFHTVIRIYCGENWLDTWWSTINFNQPTLASNEDWARGSLKPLSFVEFTMQVELFTFSEFEISQEISKNPEVSRSPKLLYYMLIGNACSIWTTNHFLYHGPKQWQQYAWFLLRNGFDPNMRLEITVDPDRHHLMSFNKGNESKISDEDIYEDICEVDNETEQDIVSKSRGLDASHYLPQITIMHLALAIACTNDRKMMNDKAIARLEMLSILVEGGGNANVLNYRNYWSHRAGEAIERSAIHYLLSSTYCWNIPFQSREPSVNNALYQCISTFLNHGANPNAVDSNGVSIFELALPLCPYALINLMLEKGAQVTPCLLSESGAPLGHADGILDEPRWRSIECYTQEARVIARKYNTHWADLEEEKQVLEQDRELWHDIGNILSTVGGYFSNWAGSVKRWS